RTSSCAPSPRRAPPTPAETRGKRPGTTTGGGAIEEDAGPPAVDSCLHLGRVDGGRFHHGTKLTASAFERLKKLPQGDPIGSREQSWKCTRSPGSISPPGPNDWERATIPGPSSIVPAEPEKRGGA